MDSNAVSLSRVHRRTDFEFNDLISVRYDVCAASECRPKNYERILSCRIDMKLDTRARTGNKAV